MLKSSFAFLILLLLTAGLFAQRGPKLQSDNLNHDFGTVEPDGYYEHDFHFTNDGDEPLEILSVKPSCGCITAKVDKNTLQPGESGTMHIRFASGKRTGHQRKSILVETNEKSVPRTTFRIEVNIHAPLVITPKFANIGTGQSSVEVELSTEDVPKLELKVTGTSADLISAKVEQVGDQKVKMTIEVDRSKMTGAVRATVDYETNIPKHKSGQVYAIVAE